MAISDGNLPQNVQEQALAIVLIASSQLAAVEPVDSCNLIEDSHVGWRRNTNSAEAVDTAGQQGRILQDLDDFVEVDETEAPKQLQFRVAFLVKAIDEVEIPAVEAVSHRHINIARGDVG